MLMLKSAFPSLNDPGQSQLITTPVAAKPLSFNLAIDDHSTHDDNEHGPPSPHGLISDNESVNTARIEDSDARLMEMLAAQAAHREVDSLAADETSIAVDEKLTDAEKRDILQRSLNMAASNGDVERVQKLLDGKAKEYVDVNMPDEEGTVPLIYASCFVRTLYSFFLLCFPRLRVLSSSSSKRTRHTVERGVSDTCSSARVTKMSCLRYLTPELMLTSKTAINGAR